MLQDARFSVSGVVWEESQRGLSEIWHLKWVLNPLQTFRRPKALYFRRNTRDVTLIMKANNEGLLIRYLWTHLSNSVMLSHDASLSHWVHGLSIWPSLSSTYIQQMINHQGFSREPFCNAPMSPGVCYTKLARTGISQAECSRGGFLQIRSCCWYSLNLWDPQISIFPRKIRIALMSDVEA